MKKIAIYDFDGTFITKKSLPFILHTWKQYGYSKRAYYNVWVGVLPRYILYKLPLYPMSKERFRLYAMKKLSTLFKTIDQEELLFFLMLVYQLLKPHINKSIITQLHKDKKDGYHCVLLSGNYDLILAPFKAEGFDDVIGSKLMKGGNIIPFKEIEVLMLERKVQAIKAKYPNLNVEQAKAYADSYYDLPILKLVRYPVVVNPDEMLRKYAQKHAWPIMD